MSFNEQIGPEIHIDSVDKTVTNIQGSNWTRKVDIENTTATSGDQSIDLKARVIKQGNELHTNRDANTLKMLYENGNKHVPAFISLENGRLEQEYIRGVEVRNIDFEKAGIHTTAKILSLYLEAVRSFAEENVYMIDANESNFKIETDTLGRPVNAVCIDFGTGVIKTNTGLNEHYNLSLDLLAADIVPKKSLSFTNDIQAFFKCTMSEAEMLSSIITDHTEKWENKQTRLERLATSGPVNPIEAKVIQDTILISEKDLEEKIIPGLKN